MLELNKIYCGDNCDVLGMLPRHCVNLVVTSPPYDSLRTYGGHEWDFYGVAWQLKRVLKPSGVIVWVVGDATEKGSETGSSLDQALHFKKLGLNLHDTMIYQKDNPPPVGGNNRYYQHFEYMYVFSLGAPKTFNPITQARRNKWEDKRTQRVKGFTRDTNGDFVKKLVQINDTVKLGNIWKYVVGGGNSVDVGTKHPAGFPESLVEDHIRTWSNPGDLVIDPFVGSGTTPKVAQDLGRDYLGIDINPEYCESSRKRCLAQRVLSL